MRGRLGIGTERVLDHRHHRHVRDCTPVSLAISAQPVPASASTGIAARRAGCARARAGYAARAQRTDCGDCADACGERPEREGRGGEHEPAERRADRSGEAPRERVHGEVAAAQVRGPDLGDERLMCRSVEALADAEDARARPPSATNALVPSSRRLRSRASATRRPRGTASARARASGADPRSARDRKLSEDDDDRVDEEQRPIWCSLTSAWSRANGGTQVEERVAGRDEEEVQHPEPEEHPVAQDGAVRARRVRAACSARPASWTKKSTTT